MEQELRDLIRKLSVKEVAKLPKHYEVYHQADPNKGWHRLKGRIVPKGNSQRKWWWVAVVAVGLGIVTYRYLSRSTVPQTVAVTREVAQAIETAEAKGKNDAYIMLDNNHGVEVSNDSILTSQIEHLVAMGVLTSHDCTLQTRHDKEFWTTLSDGTRVHLNYSTSLTYPLEFAGDNREVNLDGEAYFIVAKDENRPFIVHTPQGTIRDYGTEFNVNTRQQKGVTQVVLVHGSIGVSVAGRTEQRMRPGQLATLTHEEQTLKTVDVAPYIAWNTGTFTFDDCSLEDLMLVLSNWYDLDVDYRDAKARKVKFMGAIDKYGTPESTIDAISTITGVPISIRGRKVLVGMQ